VAVFQTHRILGWEKISPAWQRSLSGQDNNLADFLSHGQNTLLKTIGEIGRNAKKPERICPGLPMDATL
jgi:hypothetical protein